MRTISWRATLALAALLALGGPAWAQEAPPDAPPAAPDGPPAAEPAPTEGEPAPAAEAPPAAAPEAPGEAPAEPPTEAEEPAQPALPEGFEPPKLIEEVQPDYPAEAQAQKLAGDVVLLVTIDETGTVTEATVVQPVHPLLDEAALVAGYQLRFEPARMNDAPVPVQIQYRYGFTYVEETVEVAAPVDEEKPTGILEGQLFQRGTVDPLPGVRVLLRALERETFSDAEGRFRFEELPTGPLIISIEDEVYGDIEDEEIIEAGQSVQVTYRLEKETFGDRIQVFGKRPKKEVVRRTITVEEIRTIPGTNGDALGVVQNLPGVARTPFGQSDLILRGGGNTQAYLNQQPIPIAFHFGGIRSTVASALIESIDVYPGNFDVEYGRVSGGIVDVRLREPRTDRIHGYVEADVFDAGALVEGPLGEHGGLAVAVRRSYFDGLLAAAPLPDSFTITTAPRWYDAQILYDYNHDGHRLRALFYGSSDRFETVIEEPPEQNTLIRGDAVAKLEWVGGQVEHTWKMTEALENKANVAYLLTSVDFGVGEIFSLDFLFHQLFVRNTVRATLADDLELKVGMDVLNQWVSIDALGGITGPPREGETGGGFGSDRTISVEIDTFEADCALFAAAEWKLGPVLLIPGVRFDVFSAIDDYRLQPRFTARWTVTEGTVIKGGVGQYVELPDGQDTSPEIGNPNLKGEDSLHYSVGFEHDFTDAINLDITAYYKTFDDLVTRARSLEGASDVESSVDAGDAPPLLNQGEGRSYGVELLLRHDFSNRIFGWISYTLQRSERRDRPGEDWRLFDFDQTHNLIVIGQYKVTPKWTVGFRWRTTSGNPDTPIVDSVFDANTGTYVQIAGEANSTRQPTFNQLDLRVDREWTYDTWRLIGYLDLRNTFNTANAAGYQYNYDFTQRTQAYEIPIIPSFGLRGEF